MKSSTGTTSTRQFNLPGFISHDVYSRFAGTSLNSFTIMCSRVKFSRSPIESSKPNQGSLFLESVCGVLLLHLLVTFSSSIPVLAQIVLGSEVTDEVNVLFQKTVEVICSFTCQYYLQIDSSIGPFPVSLSCYTRKRKRRREMDCCAITKMKWKEV